MGTFMSKHAANLLNINPIDNKASAMNMKGDDKQLGDVNNDGIMSGWETARQKAIDENS
jgi:hypothetical protein